MKDFDFSRFNVGHWFFAFQPVMLVLLMIAGLAPRPADGFLTLLLLVTGTTLYGLFLVAYPRADGAYRGLGVTRGKGGREDETLGDWR